MAQKNSGNPEEGSEIEKSPANCSVCLEMVSQPGDRSVAKLKCGHDFHLDCIGSAFNAKGVMQCPNCRQVEDGQWLYTNGSLLQDEFMEEIVDENDNEIHEEMQNVVPQSELQSTEVPRATFQGSQQQLLLSFPDNHMRASTSIHAGPTYRGIVADRLVEFPSRDGSPQFYPVPSRLGNSVTHGRNHPLLIQEQSERYTSISHLPTQRLQQGTNGTYHGYHGRPLSQFQPLVLSSRSEFDSFTSRRLGRTEVFHIPSSPSQMFSSNQLSSANAGNMSHNLEGHLRRERHAYANAGHFGRYSNWCMQALPTANSNHNDMIFMGSNSLHNRQFQ